MKYRAVIEIVADEDYSPGVIRDRVFRVLAEAAGERIDDHWSAVYVAVTACPSKVKPGEWIPPEEEKS